MSKTGETESPKDSGKKGRPTSAEQLGKYRSGSQGSLRGSFKRKREEGEAEEERRIVEKELIENFQKARRVGRSPPQEDTKREGTEGEPKDIKMDKLDRLTELALRVKKDTQDIKKENESINEEIRELKKEWKRKQETWEREKEEIQKRIKNLETKRDKTDKFIQRINSIERKEKARGKREKRNSITLKGEELPRGETPKDTAEKVISENLQVEMEIEDEKGREREYFDSKVKKLATGKGDNDEEGQIER